MKKAHWPTTVLVFTLLTGCAMVQRTAPGTLSNADVLSVFGTIDQNEIEAAELAREKASSPMVRDYAKSLLQQHTAMLDEKRAIVNRMNVRPAKPRLASALEQANQETLETLRNKSGSEFDRAYVDYQIIMHDQAIKLSRDTAASVDDSRIKQHLIEARPDLASHLRTAQTIRQQLAMQ